jgi:hypothetical protein
MGEIAAGASAAIPPSGAATQIVAKRSSRGQWDDIGPYGAKPRGDFRLKAAENRRFQGISPSMIFLADPGHFTCGKQPSRK